MRWPPWTLAQSNYRGREQQEYVLPRQAQHSGYNHPAFAEHQMAPVPRHAGSGLGAPLAKQRVTNERLFANYANWVLFAVNRPPFLAVSLRELLLEVGRPFGDQRAVAERSVEPAQHGAAFRGREPPPAGCP
jgi:hypothetical protein